jgi:hypothetical protein
LQASRNVSSTSSTREVINFDIDTDYVPCIKAHGL